MYSIQGNIGGGSVVEEGVVSRGFTPLRTRTKEVVRQFDYTDGNNNRISPRKEMRSLCRDVTLC